MRRTQMRSRPESNSADLICPCPEPARQDDHPLQRFCRLCQPHLVLTSSSWLSVVVSDADGGAGGGVVMVQWRGGASIRTRAINGAGANSVPHGVRWHRYIPPRISIQMALCTRVPQEGVGVGGGGLQGNDA